MKAEPILREKRILTNKHTGDLAIAELKVWRVPKSGAYPAGVKFSLFLVSDGQILVGMDNHKPKGPHLHLGEQEVPYEFHDAASLVADFWDLARKAGFEP